MMMGGQTKIRFNLRWNNEKFKGQRFNSVRDHSDLVKWILSRGTLLCHQITSDTDPYDGANGTNDDFCELT